MAKQRYGINDGFRGTVGTVIGYEWNGRWCMRSRPRHVYNPRTVKQQQNRGLFAAASRLATAMGEALRVGMLSAARECHHTVYNHFLSINTECFSLTDGQLNVDYEHLVVSEGEVAPVGFSHPALRAPLYERGDDYLHTFPPLREGSPVNTRRRGSHGAVPAVRTDTWLLLTYNGTLRGQGQSPARSHSGSPEGRRGTWHCGFALPSSPSLSHLLQRPFPSPPRMCETTGDQLCFHSLRFSDYKRSYARVTG